MEEGGWEASEEGLCQAVLWPRPLPAPLTLSCCVPGPWVVPGQPPVRDLKGAAVLFWDGAAQLCACCPCTWHLAVPRRIVGSSIPAEGPEGSRCPVPCGLPLCAAGCLLV